MHFVPDIVKCLHIYVKLYIITNYDDKKNHCSIVKVKLACCRSIILVNGHDGPPAIKPGKCIKLQR